MPVILRNRKSGKQTGPLRVPFLLAFTGLLLVGTLFVIFQSQQQQELRGHAQTLKDCAVNDPDILMDSEEQKLFDMINDYRTQNGAGVLKVSPSLMRGATWLSNDMSKSKNLDHIDSLGRDPFERASDCGYPGGGGGENIAYNDGSASRTFEQWRTSTSGHNEEMLRTSNVVAGIARSGIYWTFATGREDDSGGEPTEKPAEPTAAPTAEPTIGPTITTPPNTVPSPACLGTSCVPTAAPSGDANPSPTHHPTVAVQPTTGTNPGVTNPVVTAPPANPTPPPPSGGGNSLGVVGVFLAFLGLILKFFLALLGG